MEGEAGKGEIFVWKWLNWDCLNSLLELLSFLLTWKKSSDQLYALTTCSYFSNSLKIEVGFLAYNCSRGIKGTFISTAEESRRNKDDCNILVFPQMKKESKSSTHLYVDSNPEQYFSSFRPLRWHMCVVEVWIQGEMCFLWYGASKAFLSICSSPWYHWMAMVTFVTGTFNFTPVTVIFCTKIHSVEDLVFFQQSYWELLHCCLLDQDYTQYLLKNRQVLPSFLPCSYSLQCRQRPSQNGF